MFKNTLYFNTDWYTKHTPGWISVYTGSIDPEVLSRVRREAVKAVTKDICQLIEEEDE